jgi:hypothetical protein
VVVVIVVNAVFPGTITGATAPLATLVGIAATESDAAIPRDGALCGLDARTATDSLVTGALIATPLESSLPPPEALPLEAYEGEPMPAVV